MAGESPGEITRQVPLVTPLNTKSCFFLSPEISADKPFSFLSVSEVVLEAFLSPMEIFTVAESLILFKARVRPVESIIFKSAADAEPTTITKLRKLKRIPFIIKILVQDFLKVT